MPSWFLPRLTPPAASSRNPHHHRRASNEKRQQPANGNCNINRKEKKKIIIKKSVALVPISDDDNEKEKRGSEDDKMGCIHCFLTALLMSPLLTACSLFLPVNVFSSPPFSFLLSSSVCHYTHYLPFLCENMFWEQEGTFMLLPGFLACSFGIFLFAFLNGSDHYFCTFNIPSKILAGGSLLLPSCCTQLPSHSRHPFSPVSISLLLLFSRLSTFFSCLLFFPFLSLMHARPPFFLFLLSLLSLSHFPAHLSCFLLPFFPAFSCLPFFSCLHTYSYSSFLTSLSSLRAPSLPLFLFCLSLASLYLLPPPTLSHTHTICLSLAASYLHISCIFFCLYLPHLLLLAYMSLLWFFHLPTTPLPATCLPLPCTHTPHLPPYYLPPPFPSTHHAPCLPLCLSAIMTMTMTMCGVMVMTIVCVCVYFTLPCLLYACPTFSTSLLLLEGEGREGGWGREGRQILPETVEGLPST